jgi:hypothetical protein
MKRSVLCGAVTLVLACAAFAAEPVRLPGPAKNGGAALLDCLSARRAGRVFNGRALSGQELSDLLWATGGVSSGDGKLTYPTAQDVRDIVIYVFTESGVSRYDAGANALMPVLSGDHRGETGKQPFAANASVDLVYVQDRSCWSRTKTPPEAIVQLGYAHAGAAAQNASLFAAAKGWSSVVRGSVDRAGVGRLLGLSDTQHVLLAHSIGPRP